MRQTSLLWILAIAAEKNISLVTAISALSDESSGLWGNKLDDLANMIQQGTPIQEAVAAVPGVLPDESILAIRSAAESGTLMQAFKSEATRMSYEQERSSFGNLVSLATYVSFILFTTIAIVSFLMVYIVPKMKKIFEDFGMELPRVTASMIDATDFAAHYLAILFPLGVLGAGGIAFLGYRSVSRGLLASPLVRIFPRLGAPSALRAMSFVVDAGRPLAPALESLANHHPSQSMYFKLNDVAETTAAGGDCWEGFCHHRLLTQREVEAVQSAEKAGNAGWMLRNIAQDLERLFERRFNDLIGMAGPIFVLFLGVLVAFFAIGFFAPLIKLVSDLS